MIDTQDLPASHRQTGERQSYEACRLFICIGGDRHTGWAAEAGIVRDGAGYLVTGRDLLKSSPSSARLAPGPESMLLEHARRIRGWGCAARIGQALRIGSRRGAMAVTLVHRYLAGN
jgi:thioredoxin reductase (NADPH)